ncbi:MULTISPECIES: tail protein X [Pseudomonas]|uniref:Phage tail protein n=1 Tax=Pseudomonas fluorescens TaxID=294 RepID=A0A0F4TC89_PSEFL|nr:MULTISPECIES: tail protein X [Pseudomonas]KJZ41729.1 phage tail protein [Pseudomonas fluorescens]
MATTCRTSDGDLLDTLCHNYYGHLSGSVEAVLDANQGLAEEEQPFRTGLIIVLPDLPSPVTEAVTLWD